MKKFYLPGYYSHFEMFLLLDNFYNTHQNYFIEDREIAGAYDLPYGLIWNGGRLNLECDLKFNKERTEKVMNYFISKNNFNLLHTCTNSFLTSEHYLDQLCNNFIQQYYRLQDKIIIADFKLKEYLQKQYPQISFIYSTTLGITDIDKVNQLSKNNIYVLYYGKNDDDKYLKQLNHPENIEILCGEHCIKNCPYRSKHYLAVSQAQLGLIPDLTEITPCPASCKDNNIPLTDLIEKSTYRVNNQRIEELSQMGFNNFKISGRLFNAIDWFTVITYYLVKPQYQGLVYNTLINNYMLYINTK